MPQKLSLSHTHTPKEENGAKQTAYKKIVEEEKLLRLCPFECATMKLNNWKQFVNRDPSTIIILISNKFLAVSVSRRKRGDSANSRKILLLCSSKTPVDYLFCRCSYARHYVHLLYVLHEIMDCERLCVCVGAVLDSGWPFISTLTMIMRSLSMSF